MPRRCQTLGEQGSPQLPLIVLLVRKLLVGSCVSPTEALWGRVQMTLHPGDVATPSASQPHSSRPGPGSRARAEKGVKSTSLEEQEKMEIEAPAPGMEATLGCWLFDPCDKQGRCLCLSSSEREIADLAPRDERIRKHCKCPLFLLSTAKLQRTPNPGVSL